MGILFIENLRAYFPVIINILGVFLGFLCGSAGKESTCNAGDLDLIPGLGRFPGEGNDDLLQYFCMENSIETP